MEPTNNSFTFTFDPQIYPLTKTNPPRKVFVRGTFNIWTHDFAEKLELKRDPTGNWTLTLPMKAINIPGNSGRPEYLFYYVDTEGKRHDPVPIYTKKGFSMLGNNLILYPEDAPAYYEKEAAFAQTELSLADFDLTNPEDRFRLSNIRLVPGTKNIWRGYHTYKKSRDTQTEGPRLLVVKEFLESQNIKSIITLSGKEEPIEGQEEICTHEQAIISQENELFVDTSYETVYYNSDGKEFKSLMQQIVSFINTHTAPFYIHCRLGSDRTGVTCAVLAALAGADWQEICKDYHRTSFMGIKEYRSPDLLKYSFEKLLGKPITDVKNLQEEVAASLELKEGIRQQPSACQHF